MGFGTLRRLTRHETSLLTEVRRVRDLEAKVGKLEPKLERLMRG